jgi:O-antigen ligase
MTRNITFVAAAALLALALAVGGAGENFPLLGMLLGLASLAAAAALFWYRAPERLTTLGRCAIAFTAALLLLPALQLVPLPPAIWHALPGRDVVAQIDAGLGVSIWRPLTLDVEGTIRALLSLIPACVLFVLCVRLHTRERGTLLMIVAAFALLNALLGIIQLATGGSMTPYPSAHIGYPIGLFVNRNHSAVFMLIALPIIAALASRRMQTAGSKLPYLVGSLALLTIVSVVIIATTSRMALALLPLALIGSLALLFFRQSLLRVAVPSTLALGVIAATISWVGGFNRNLSRFSSLHDGRFDYWDDVSWALHHYGLAGTGFGTFIPVYQTAESLSSVGPAILNHAHNDFIEIVLEGGIPAITLLLLFFIILGFAGVQLMKKRFEFNRASLALASAVGVMLVLIFSLVDYPLRMPALSCVFAVLCACLLPTPVPLAPGTELVVRREGRPWAMYGTRAFGSAALAAVAIVILQAGVSAKSLLIDQYAIARGWAPWSTAAHEVLADDALAASKPAVATDEALKALRLSPIDAVALRTAAMARTLKGSTASGRQLMAIAVSLGWRDPFTQLWAIAASEQTGEGDKAVQRAQALFQQDLFLPSSLELLLRAPQSATARSLVETLSSRPEWRADFVKAAAQLPSAYDGNVDDLLFRVNASQAPLSIDEARPLLERLIEANDLADARRLWAGTHPDGVIANGNFEQVGERAGADVPRDWDISDEDLATIAIQAPQFGGHGRALRISAAARSGPILSQRLMLPPGAYSVSYRARSGDGATVALRWQLSCSSSDERRTSKQLPATSGGWQEFSTIFSVPIQDCPIQRLALERPNAIHSHEVWVDDVIMQPIR